MTAGRRDQLAEWRIGRHYGIHVYEGDRPVATFHDAADAARCVAAINSTSRATSGIGLIGDSLLTDRMIRQAQAEASWDHAALGLEGVAGALDDQQIPAELEPGIRFAVRVIEQTAQQFRDHAAALRATTEHVAVTGTDARPERRSERPGGP